MITDWAWTANYARLQSELLLTAGPFHRIEHWDLKSVYPWAVGQGMFIAALFRTDTNTLQDEDLLLAINLCEAKYGYGA